ncbi:MAG: hypothetical protein D4S02_07590 [Rhodocyclaceae bacterium]|nr:MAG: hypothetical protein D4S02_07590 [Rhodocyclaceae bacterium]
MKRLAVLILLFGINGQLQAAIEPVYDGINGIRNSVLTVCLQCHSKTLSGSARKDAPVGFNVDTYADAIFWVEEAVARVSARTMPPAGNTPLTSEQRAAMVAWQAAGFPEKSGSVQDTQAPTTPAELTATAVGTRQINLAWTASTDNVGVTSYKIYRGGTQIATQGNVISYADKALSLTTIYNYSVAACDAAANCSAPSLTTTATTIQPADCLFNWAETSVPSELAPRTQSQFAFPYYYRFYPPGTYLATASNRLLYFGPLSPTTILDLGDVATWYATSGCN